MSSRITALLSTRKECQVHGGQLQSRLSRNNVKSTSPVTENHYKNGYVNYNIYKNFIMTNEDINNDTKYTNTNDMNKHDARDLHVRAQQHAVGCLSCLVDNVS